MPEVLTAVVWIEMEWMEVGGREEVVGGDWCEIEPVSGGVG